MAGTPIYPRDYPLTTAGSANVTSLGVGYQSLRIQGYAYGSHGLSEGLTNDPDGCVFPNVSVATEFGGEVKTKCRVPIMTGALGSTFIAAHYWDSFAVGAALCGFPIVVDENVVGVDRKSTLENGGITNAPELDLLTIDGTGGGTGMSPWNMMDHWGVPSLPLHAKAYEYCKMLEEQGIKVPDISFAGGFAREDHIFKALALGAPYAKLVCMGRAPMIPGYLGSNIQGVFQEKTASSYTATGPNSRRPSRRPAPIRKKSLPNGKPSKPKSAPTK